MNWNLLHTYAAPIYLLGILIELGWTWIKGEKSIYNYQDTRTNLIVGLTYVVLWTILKGPAPLFWQWFYEFSPFKIDESPHNFILGFILIDFLYYWFHRVSHESQFFWNFHVVHHSSRSFNLSVAVRQSWFGSVFSWVFFVPAALLGFNAETIAGIYFLNLFYQFWIHTPYGSFLNWAGAILNTPSHHSVHHARDAIYIDRNYGGVFIIWDRIFGSFQKEVTQPHYGITIPPTSDHPLWLNLHTWHETWLSAKAEMGWLRKARCFFGSTRI